MGSAKRGMAEGAFKSIGAIALAGALVAACSSGGSSSSSSTTSGGGGSSATIDNSLALAYTGGTAGKATGTPINIGYVNQESGSPSYPENTQGADLAVKYINNDLGGIKGHPINLVKCFVSTEEDGQKCGTQMLNDPSIKLVVT